MADTAKSTRVMPRPRQAVLEMAPYSPPTAGRADKLRLDFNENTDGCSPQVIEYLRKHLTPDRLAVYPEYGDANRKLAAHFGVPAERLLLTNGTDEAIQLVVHTYVDDGGEVALLRPSYAMYKFYAQVAGARLRETDYRPGNLAFPLEELQEAITPDTRVVLIANPNNPTGTAVRLEGVRRILERAANAAVLIDEAYFEFFGVTALPLLEDYPNLFVSRTFSKVYGLAGMRLGCLFSAEGNIAYLHKAQSPYSVNTLAALAACAAVQDGEHLRNYVAEVIEAREFLYRSFEEMGIEYLPSEANFVLMRLGGRALEIRDRLRVMGILVRDRSYELPGCVRVTVGRRAQVERFLEALRQVW